MRCEAPCLVLPRSKTDSRERTMGWQDRRALRRPHISRPHPRERVRYDGVLLDYLDGDLTYSPVSWPYCAVTPGAVKWKQY